MLELREGQLLERADRHLPGPQDRADLPGDPRRRLGPDPRSACRRAGSRLRLERRQLPRLLAARRHRRPLLPDPRALTATGWRSSRSHGARAARPARRSAQIHRLKRELLLLRRAVWPMREVVQTLQREPHECLSETTRDLPARRLRPRRCRSSTSSRPTASWPRA